MSQLTEKQLTFHLCSESGNDLNGDYTNKWVEIRVDDVAVSVGGTLEEAILSFSRN